MDLEGIISKAFEKRAGLFESNDTDCFRLFHSEGDGMNGLCVDFYAGFILVQYTEIVLNEAHTQIARSLDSALRRIPTPVRGIFLKKNFRENREGDDNKISSLSGDSPPESFTVVQNGARAIVRLTAGRNTGIFLDMREIRKSLAQFYSGCGILNLFCYTGMASVHGLMNGAHSALNVDLSMPALSWAMENYRMNGLSVDEGGFIHGDVFSWMKIFLKKQRLFDFIIFDPPTFSRNRRRSFSVKGDFGEHLKILSGLTGRYVFTSVNAKSVSLKDYISFHPRPWRSLFTAHEPPDFPWVNAPYLKAGLWERR